MVTLSDVFVFFNVSVYTTVVRTRKTSLKWFVSYYGTMVVLIRNKVFIDMYCRLLFCVIIHHVIDFVINFGMHVYCWVLIENKFDKKCHCGAKTIQQWRHAKLNFMVSLGFSWSGFLIVLHTCRYVDSECLRLFWVTVKHSVYLEIFIPK